MSDDMDVTWTKVATLDDLWEGDFLGVEVDGEEVIVVHLPGGELRCFQGMCPHQEILLADGKVDFEAGTITCSAHEWEFSMDDGRGLNPRDCRLFRYAVKKDGETILVGVPNDGRPRRLRHKAEQDA
ncbi:MULTISPECIES: Rieske 2Fe-2S domain-containing protein [unclassified Bradyrhizobium]|uniref:Rieske 2Fe-2S domain-containing protein n=1 Tax=unclassified Bradyrhizobium TaxID=2631580 RepID=UPI002915D95F|nr:MULTISPECIES: Rieske 2Fe-2S domain-containing protein [unclassified Bradyrhizobium]